MERLEAELKALRRAVSELGTRVAPAALSLTEAAQMLSCSPKHVARLVQRGVLSPRDIGGLRRIPVSQIHALLAAPSMESSGATPERKRFDGAAALAELKALRKTR